MRLSKKLVAPMAAISLAACAGQDAAIGSRQDTAAQVKSGAANADAQTRRVVDAANAFLASLNDTQRKAAIFAFTDTAQRARWSNFPQGIFTRQGVAWGDLNADQRAALMTLLGTVLSPYGVQMVKDQMDADEVLKANPGAGGGPGGGRGGRGGPPPAGRPGGPPGGGRGPGGGGPGGGLLFGADLYFVAFLGQPSATSPWMLQFGGHHLGINATVAGPNITLAPSLTGGQPTKFTKDGRTVYIVEREVQQAQAMLDGLTPAQRAKAVLAPQGIDLVLGPGHDGQVLQPEGLAAAEMTPAQKAQFLKLIEARIGILNEDAAGAAMADIRKNLDKTYFAWFGPTNDAGSAYFRADGPTLILEFSPQAMGGDPSNHLHNMYRNPTNDYGAAWASPK